MLDIVVKSSIIISVEKEKGKPPRRKDYESNKLFQKERLYLRSI